MAIPTVSILNSLIRVKQITIFYTTQNSFIWEGSVNKSRLLNTFSSAFMLIKMIVMNDDDL